MIQPPVEKIVDISQHVESAQLSKDGDLFLVVYGNGYEIHRGDNSIFKEESASKVELLRERDIVVVSEGRSISFYNSAGALLWKNTYEDHIVDFSFSDGVGVILLSNKKIIYLTGYSTVLGSVECRDDASGIMMEPTGRYFLVVGKMGIDAYSAGSLSKLWTQDFMEDIHRVTVNKGLNRVAVSLETGDFYLLNRSGKRILEYKFKTPPLHAFTPFGNVVICEDEEIKIMNDQGTVLKVIKTEGRCMDLKASENSEYAVCGTNTGRIYFFDKSGLLWDYKHKEGIISVDITPLGEYVLAANKEVIIFNNLAYYLSVLSEVKGTLSKLSPKNPKYSNLYELSKKMKSAYLKKDFKVMMNLKSMFDSIYQSIEKSKLHYVMIVSDYFSQDNVSKNLLFVDGAEMINIKVYGDFRYKVIPMKAKKKNLRKFLIFLQPKSSGILPIKIVLYTNRGKVEIRTRIYVDGVSRAMRIISNTKDYRRLIS